MVRRQDGSGHSPSHNPSGRLLLPLRRPGGGVDAASGLRMRAARRVYGLLCDVRADDRRAICAPRYLEAPMSPPVVRSHEEVDQHAGGEAVVEGLYEPQDVRVRPVGEPEYRGHAAVVLADGTCVFLCAPSEGEALRPSDEIARFGGRTVRASGTLLAGNPDKGAAIDAPCLVQITSIELA
jgi:hypothetical protein